MQKKKMLALLTAGILSMSMLVGCGSKKANEEANANLKPTDLKIGLATDQGGLGDKSFNDLANKGLEDVKKVYNLKVQVLQSSSSTVYEQNLKELSDSNDLTFATGFTMEDATSKIAAARKDKKFAIIDAYVDMPNVNSISFKEHEGAFLMGVIAGKMTKTNKVGFIGGIDNNPVIEKFEAGYIAGVKAVNPEAAKGLIAEGDAKHGKYSRYVGTFGDPTKGGEYANQLYNEGVDVIFHAAGGTGVGVINKAAELREQGKNVWVIGVDQDQAVTMPNAKDAILSSCIKRVDIAVENVATKFLEGIFEGGKETVFGIAENGMDIAETRDNLPESVIEEVENYRKQIVDGAIAVPATLAELK